MKDETLDQSMKRLANLEEGVARQLGQVLIEFSRLDVNLALGLVWTTSHLNATAASRPTDDLNLYAKMCAIAKLVEAKFPPQSEARNAYDRWAGRMNTMRLRRNDIVHGRWGFDVKMMKAVNVMGVPGQGNERSTAYSIEDLVAFNAEIRALSEEWGRLQKHWRL
jgi:hypothetical protein